MMLTPRQKKILKKGLKNGKLRYEDFMEYYANKICRKECIERFITCGLMNETSFSHFELNVDEVNKELE